MGTTTVDPVEFGTKTEIKCSHLIGTEILNTVLDVGSFTAMARLCTWPSFLGYHHGRHKTRHCVKLDSLM